METENVYKLATTENALHLKYAETENSEKLQRFEVLRQYLLVFYFDRIVCLSFILLLEYKIIEWNRFK